MACGQEGGAGSKCGRPLQSLGPEQQEVASALETFFFFFFFLSGRGVNRRPSEDGSFEMGHWKINRNSPGRRGGYGGHFRQEEELSHRDGGMKDHAVFGDPGKMRWCPEPVWRWEGGISERQAEVRGHRG